MAEINQGNYNNPKVEELLIQLSDRLSKTSGKKVYGYLKADVKAIVDRIVEELEKDSRIAELYDLWYEQTEEIKRTYTATVPKRVPLSQNKEFKTIRNAVIQKAMHIMSGKYDADINESQEFVTDEFSFDMEQVEYHSTEGAAPESTYTANEHRRYSGQKKKDTWWIDEYKKLDFITSGRKIFRPIFPKRSNSWRKKSKKEMDLPCMI